MLIVEDVRRTGTARGWELSARVRAKAAPDVERLHFTVRGGGSDWVPERGDAFLAALVMPAMSLGEDLLVDAPVSARLLRSARTAMEIYSAWWERFGEVRLTATETAVPAGGEDAVGLFFTTGVDCFYSLLKDGERRTEPHHQPVTDLLFANFEQDSGTDHDRLVARIGHVAARSRCRAVVVDTNIRSFAEPLTTWEAYHGAALGGVALALQGLLGRCLIAASDQYRHLPPLGSHPLLDHLWSTERLEIVHDGAEATRTGKVERRLSGSALALDNLGVCWRSRPGHNCGACEKCLRTMAALELAGALRRCRTLPRVLDLHRLRTVPVESEDARVSMRELAQDARQRGRHDIADAAEHALR
ncbi:hypothetical protein ABTX81_29940 [Kitasatospora sp. NPDC097605]|uniref:hypothetical protein n=1 Tax=Kitasatospora sp. NPDC097605 TaxID=3157226 RepID=UPI0033224F99